MKVTLDKLPASQVSFAIEIESTKSKAVYDRTVKQLQKSVQVPGFRPGKAPLPLVLRQVGNDRLKVTVLEDILEESLQQVLKDHTEIKAIGSFRMISSMEDLVKDFDPSKGFSFVAAIDVEPEANLKEYQGFTVQAEEVLPDLTQVDKTLYEYQVRRSTLIPVEGRGLQPGDVATIDVTVTDLETGDPISEAAETDLQVDIPVEGQDPKYIPEVVAALVGMAVGDTKEVAGVVTPDAEIAEYAGDKVSYTIKVNDIKTRELPELNDQFAKDISDQETLADLRSLLEKRIVDDATRKTDDNRERAILNALVAELEVELPQTVVRKEVEFLIEQQAQYLAEQMDPSYVKRLFTNELISEMAKLNEPEAVSRIKRKIALDELAKKANVTVTDEAVAARAEGILADLNRDDIDPERLKEVLKDEMVTKEALKWVLANSTVEMVPEGSLASAQNPTVESDDESEGEAVVAEVV
ncbi:MAG: trigger factor [Pseudanabaenaceae cyanobacterium]|jgi:trigger factor